MGTDAYGTRANGLGVSYSVVNFISDDFSETGDIIILSDNQGFRPVLKTNEDYGDGVITRIGNVFGPTSPRRGLSNVNLNGQFVVTVGFQDGTQGLYRITGENIYPLPEKLSDTWGVE